MWVEVPQAELFVIVFETPTASYVKTIVIFAFLSV